MTKSLIPNVCLTPRQKQVLNSVVQNFIVSASPVSSKIVSQDKNINASSATVRNTMAQLEAMGLMGHHHTSAGRFPTDLGYRIYLNSLMELQELAVKDKHVIISKLMGVNEEQQILRLSSVLISKMTNLMGIAVFSLVANGVIEKMTLVPLAEKKVMMILTVTGGMVRSVVVELNLDLPDSKILKMEDFLNEKIAGKPVSFLNNDYFNQLGNYVGNQDSGTIRIFTRSILKLLNSVDESSVHIYGTKNVVHQPDFEKIEDIEGIIELLDNKKTLVHFLQSRGKQEGIHITIGNEHKLGLFKTHSAITSTFNFGGFQGTIGVIGPIRMEYSKMISVVDFTASILDGKSGKSKAK